METFMKLIYCCNKEEIKKDQQNFEFQVPFKKENENNNQQLQLIQDISEPMIIDSSKIKSNDNNNAMNNTLNNTNNTSNNNLINDSNSNSNNIKTINNNININLNNNIENNINNTNRKNNIKNIIPKEPFIPSKKRIIYSNSISNNYFNINKAINNKESKKNLGSIFSKGNASKNNISNYGSILTLNNLVLTNQNQEEKNIEMCSKLLLSGELFFWKEIIISSNGIKHSLRKEKDDHVFFGVKNISKISGEPYNDLIINFLYREVDSNLIETNTGRVFEIFFNNKIKEYILRFLHPNLILYCKINNFVYFIIGKDYYFLLGNIFISINVKKTSPLDKIINIQIEVENNKPIKYSFNQNQAPIKIGRSNCEINIFNSSISKKHGIIEYSRNSQTFYYKDLGSTNGSTLIIKEGDTLKIIGEMNFKLEDIPFKIQEIP